MGNSSSRHGEGGDAVTGRAIGITGAGPLKRLAAPKLPPNAVKTHPEDYQFVQVRMSFI